MKNGWMPILTAPKDGTPILAWGFWAGEITGPEPRVKVIDIAHWEPGGDFQGYDWVCETGDAYGCWMKPTHWQPLPEPPE